MGKNHQGSKTQGSGILEEFWHFSRNYGTIKDRIESGVKWAINAISYNRNKKYLPYFGQNLDAKKKVAQV